MRLAPALWPVALLLLSVLLSAFRVDAQLCTAHVSPKGSTTDANCGAASNPCDVAFTLANANCAASPTGLTLLFALGHYNGSSLCNAAGVGASNNYAGLRTASHRSTRCTALALLR
jgi:hypothetical protein